MYVINVLNNDRQRDDVKNPNIYQANVKVNITLVGTTLTYRTPDIPGSDRSNAIIKTRDWFKNRKWEGFFSCDNGTSSMNPSSHPHLSVSQQEHSL